MQIIKKIFRTGTSMVLFANIGTSALKMVSFMILARMLSEQDFGVWSVFLTVLTSAELIRSGLIRNAMIKLQAGGQFNKNVVLGSSWIFASMITLVLMAADIVIGIIFWEQLIADGYTFIIYLFPFSVAVVLFQEFSTWTAQAEQKFHKFSYLFISQGILFLVGIILTWYYDYGLLGVAYAHLGSRLVPSFFSLIFDIRIYRHMFNFDFPTFKEIWNFGRYSVTTMISSSILRTADALILAAFMGPEAVAMFSVPIRLMELINIPIRSVNQTFFPKASRYASLGKHFKIGKYLTRVTFIFTIISIIIALLIQPTAEILTLIIGGEKYLDTSNFLRVMIWTAATGAVGNFMGVAVEASNRPDANAKMVIWISIITITLNVTGLMLFESIWVVIFTSIITKIFGIWFLNIYTKKTLNWSAFKFMFVDFKRLTVASIKLIRLKLKKKNVHLKSQNITV